MLLNVMAVFDSTAKRCYLVGVHFMLGSSRASPIISTLHGRRHEINGEFHHEACVSVCVRVSVCSQVGKP